MDLDKDPDKEPLKVAFTTMGCRSNYADTVDLQAAVLEQGALPCNFDAEADVYVINTCTVTDTADKEARKLIRIARERAPGARVVVTGCMAELQPKDLLASEQADAVIGPGRKRQVLSAIMGKESLFKEGEQKADKKVNQAYANGRRTKKSLPERRSISLRDSLSSFVPGPGSSMGFVPSRARYHLRVQEGCENSCTFCIIPQTRGLFSSRPFKDVLKDLRSLENLGYEEVVLTGTHLGGYGIDFGSSLYELLQEIAGGSFSLRLRLSSIDPNDLSCELVDLLKESPIFCNHLHICVQSFSSRILKLMNRKYQLEEAESITRYVADRIPDCGIGSDLITGFPGESREDVAQGIERFLDLPFSYLHVFPYSEREGTAATRLGEPIEINERKRRAARWRAVSEVRRRTFIRQHIGKSLELVVERIEEGFAYGTSRQYLQAMVAVGAELPKIGSRLSCKAVSYDESKGRLICE